MTGKNPYSTGINSPDHNKTTCRTCGDAPPGRLLTAIRQFNDRQWYECHDVLEALWLEETGEVRELYQGIIQVAIALHHWRNGNFSGAVKLLESGNSYLKRVASPCLWLDVAGLIRQVSGTYDELQRLGAEQMTALDQAFIPQITTVSV